MNEDRLHGRKMGHGRSGIRNATLNFLRTPGAPDIPDVCRLLWRRTSGPCRSPLHPLRKSLQIRSPGSSRFLRLPSSATSQGSDGSLASFMKPSFTRGMSPCWEATDAPAPAGCGWVRPSGSRHPSGIEFGWWGGQRSGPPHHPKESPPFATGQAPHDHRTIRVPFIPAS